MLRKFEKSDYVKYPGVESKDCQIDDDLKMMIKGIEFKATLLRDGSLVHLYCYNEDGKMVLMYYRNVSTNNFAVEVTKALSSMSSITENFLMTALGFEKNTYRSF